jgi:hypothetical protein
MNAVAIPPIRTAGARPPIIPPVGTTFDPFSEGDEPQHRMMVENVKHLLRRIKTDSIRECNFYLRLIKRRKRWIEDELQFERMLQPLEVPPLIMHAFGWDGLAADDEPVKTYVTLLNQLDEAAQRIRTTMQEQFGVVESSD